MHRRITKPILLQMIPGGIHEEECEESLPKVLDID